MTRHVNIPIFIPHEGCKNQCVFCNQKTITGTDGDADRDIRPEIDSALSTIENDAETELAFFGGSFTGIGIDKMTRLCDIADEYVKSGKIKSIRLSTRPDYIDDEILSILKERSVTNIELGIQSASDAVLSACKRGHTFAQTEKACRLIKKYGFVLGGQMMIGLPGSSPEDEAETARKIVSLGCDEARIYPCVVFKKTELCDMAMCGDYVPLTTDDAVKRSAAAYAIFAESGVKVLRIGLQSSENLSDENSVYAGANHPAMGELVLGEYFFVRISEAITSFSSKTTVPQGSTLHIACSPAELSKVIGHRKKNKERFKLEAEKNGFSNIKISPDDVVAKGAFKLRIERSPL